MQMLTKVIDFEYYGFLFADMQF